jgi:ATP-dependent RNA helicase DeaD
MLCRRGHITKLEIGAIRIFDRETRFEIVRKVAERFDAALTESPDDGVHITPLADPDAPVKRDRAGFGRPGEKSEKRPPQRREGPRQDGPRHDGPRNHDAPRYEGPRLDAPRHEGPPPAGFKGKPRGPKPAFNRDAGAPPRDFKPRGKPPKRP